jgi:hypothetical protein
MANPDALRDAAAAFLDAFGGDIPDWLQDEADALADALDASRAAPPDPLDAGDRAGGPLYDASGEARWAEAYDARNGAPDGDDDR